MPDQAHLHQMLELTAYGGIGIVVALGLLAAGLVFLDRSERRRLRAPTMLVALHLSLIGIEVLLPDDPVVRRPVRVIAVAVLLLAVGRAGFLILVHVIVGRRGQVPLPRIIQDLLQGAIYGVVGLFLLRAAGVDFGSLLTTSALLTAVIGLSLQETLGNLFAGLAIQAQRAFEIGDWIQFDADSTSIGRVVEINWRATRVLTVDQVEIIVPNGALARASIRNFSKPTLQTRRSVTIIAPAGVAPDVVHQLLASAVQKAPGVSAVPAPDVQTIGWSDRGIEYRVRFWITELDVREPIDSAVRDRLWYALQRAGLTIPPPQRHVFVHETGMEHREREQERAASDREHTLRWVDFFRELPAETLQPLAMSADRRMYGAGEIVIEEGSDGDELFVVESGEVEVLVKRDTGELVRVATLGASRFFGEMSLMTGEKRRATVRAVRGAVLLVVGKDDLQPLLEAHPSVAKEISALLAEREVALGHVQANDDTERKSIVDMRSDALLRRIRNFFSL